MAHATDIVGYTYAADLYCPRCIVTQLPTGEGGAFDGWALAPGVRMSTEDNLSEIAAAFGIDRMDESTFDSGDFPKVVFRSQLDACSRCMGTGDLGEGRVCSHCDSTGTADRCASCGEVLGE